MPRLSVVNCGTSHLCFHTCRVLIDTQNGDPALLWLQGWKISLQHQRGIQSLIYRDTRGTNKALFPFCHKHTSQRQNHLDQASSLICPTRPAVPPSVCRLGTEGYPGLHISPTNSPITHTGWGADPSSLPWKALYYMQSLCRGAKSWKAIEIPKEFAFPRDSLKSFILKAVHTGEGPSAFANKKLLS